MRAANHAENERRKNEKDDVKKKMQREAVPRLRGRRTGGRRGSISFRVTSPLGCSGGRGRAGRQWFVPGGTLLLSRGGGCALGADRDEPLHIVRAL
jgi:hypothetical protein